MPKKTSKARSKALGKPTIKVTNPKIGVELVEELNDEPEFKNVKAYTATHAFLGNVVYLGNDQEYTSIRAEKIKEWFLAYNINYKPVLDILVNHGLIEIDRQYIVGSKTRGYRLTDKGARLMCQGQMQYLKKMFVDPKLKRSLQKKLNYRKSTQQKPKHSFLEYISKGLMGYSYTQDAVKYVEDSDWPYLTKLKAMLDLTRFAERDFIELKYNEADTRCWNEFAGMKSELRRFFSLGKLNYRYVIDIRSCHPLFLAHFLINYSKDRSVSMATPVNPMKMWSSVPVKSGAKPQILQEERERSERSSITSITTITQPPSSSPILSNPTTTITSTNPILHYDGGNSDIQAELVKWNTLFSDPATDPKTVLINELGYTRDQAKAALNETINGSRQYRRFIKWFEKTFPRLFAVWDCTDKARVGVLISTYYETELMQDIALYELADTLGLHLTYEFDGCGVMCLDDGKGVLGKIQQLIAHIQARSERLWGIRPVVVVKTAAGELV